MTPADIQIWKGLKIVEGMEKVSSVIEAEFQPDARQKLAEATNELYELVVRQAAARYAVKTAGVVDYVLALRDENLGQQKHAADPDVLAESLTKFATAVYVDDVLTGLVDTAKGQVKQAALVTRTLGREYAVALMRNILA